ncbi:hypothetical protein KYK29_05325 [Shinella daejeonensis]|uniref:hypothetical protein n=1 Tax=Shinella daejeonensis TaxID=659017 RepID=UPI0020C80865|nr:hypothetical protein [Shinella daejeonensis]MCP8894343.1 hypothetical protein [Shinella daejeonensis]
MYLLIRTHINKAAETLRKREGGGYEMNDNPVSGRFVQADGLDDMNAILREAGDDPRVKAIRPRRTGRASTSSTSPPRTARSGAFTGTPPRHLRVCSATL